MFEKVLIAVDNSPHAAHALEAGRELARLAGGETRVVHVREVMVYPRSGEISNEDTEHATNVVEEAVAQLKEAGLEASGTVRVAVNGHIARQILEEADEWGATVLVLASRGLTNLAGIVIGSTTHKVLHLGHLPLLVVR